MKLDEFDHLLDDKYFKKFIKNIAKEHDHKKNIILSKANLIKKVNVEELKKRWEKGSYVSKFIKAVNVYLNKSIKMSKENNRKFQKNVYDKKYIIYEDNSCVVTLNRLSKKLSNIYVLRKAKFYLGVFLASPLKLH